MEMEKTEAQSLKSDDRAYDSSVPVAVQAQERKRRKRRIMKIAVYFMFGIISIGVFAIWLFHKDPVEYLRFGSEFIFTVKLRSLELRNVDGDSVLYADMGRQLLASPYDHCWDDQYKDYEENCLYWRKMALLHVSEHDNSTTSSCYTLKWEGLMAGFQAEDCFYLQHYQWYGYLTPSTSAWPISNVYLHYTDYYTSYPEIQTNNLVPIWYGDQNVAIFIHPSYPFSISWNVTDKRQFCIKSVNSPTEHGKPVMLMEYTICKGDSLQDIYSVTHRYRQEMDSDLMVSSNSKSLIPQKPVYALSSEETTPSFLDRMTQNGSADCGLVELFEDWQNEAGDLFVNPKLADQVNNLIKAAEAHDCYPTFPISPFFSYKSDHFQDGVEKGYFVMDSLNLATRMMIWRDLEGAALDVTNPVAIEWFTTLLNKLISENNVKALKLLHQDVPLDSSFLDSNITYLEYNKIFYHRLMSLNVSLVLEMAAGFITTPVYTPIKMSFNGEPGSSCMNTSIPYSLIMGMSGFPLLIAEVDTNTITTEEMFMRWLQLAIFYPILKIPNIPMLKSASLQEFLSGVLSLRNEEFLPYLTKVWKDQRNMPIIRPLWWSGSKDRHVLTISDQFMVGNHLLVAPVLCEGTVTRPVYLPEGIWIHSGMDPVQGPLTVQVTTDSFNVIPYFWKQDK